MGFESPIHMAMLQYELMSVSITTHVIKPLPERLFLTFCKPTSAGALGGPLDFPGDVLNLGPIEKHLTALALCFPSRNLWADRETPLVGTEVFSEFQYLAKYVLVLRFPCWCVLVKAEEILMR